MALSNLRLSDDMDTLDLPCNGIDDEGAKELSLNTTLTSLYLGCNNIKDEGAKALSLNTTLTDLNLWNNMIGEEGVNALSLNTTLTNLNLGSNYIAYETLSTIGRRLELNKSALRRGRSQFLQNMIILACDANNINSSSFWKHLPPDMRRYILQYAYQGWILGMPPKAKQKCAEFISNNIGTINKLLQRGTSWKIVYMTNKSQFTIRTE